MYIIESKSLIDINGAFKKKLKCIAEADGSITGIASGFKKLDALTKGFQPSTLTIVGGVPGMGKTAFAISLIRKMAIEYNHSTSFFSLNLSSEDFIAAIISQKTNIDFQKIRSGLLDENQEKEVYATIEQIKDGPLDFYEHPFLTVEGIEDEAFFFRHPDTCPEIIVIDSLRLLAKNKKDKVGKVLNKRELAKITEELKELAVKHKTPIILFTEIQEGEKRWTNKRPSLVNVRNHAPIVPYADLILLLYRPEYYKIDEWADDECSAVKEGDAEIVIVKNPNGVLDGVRVKFSGRRMEYEDVE